MERSDPLFQGLLWTVVFQVVLILCAANVRIGTSQRERIDRIELTLTALPVPVDVQLSAEPGLVPVTPPDPAPSLADPLPATSPFVPVSAPGLPLVPREPVTSLPPLPHARALPLRTEPLPQHDAPERRDIGLHAPGGVLRPGWSHRPSQEKGAPLPLPDSPAPVATADIGAGGPVIEGPASHRQVLHREIPSYPEGVRKEVRVVLDFVVRPDGSVGEVVPIRRLEPALDEAAVEAMRRWRFAPKPGSADSGRVTFVFVLRASSGFR